MATTQGETIVAIATAIVAQQGSIGVVRMSGKNAIAIAKQLFTAPGNQTWETHRILYGHIHNPQTQIIVDATTNKATTDNTRGFVDFKEGTSVRLHNG